MGIEGSRRTSERTSSSSQYTLRIPTQAELKHTQKKNGVACTVFNATHIRNGKIQKKKSAGLSYLHMHTSSNLTKL